MSTTISAPQGFYQNDTVTPATISDLVSVVAAASGNISQAATSATAAAASATAANTSAVSAAASNTASGNSATDSANSASTSAGSASTAGTNATNAANSASAAASSSSSASSSASSATSSSSSASGSATAASNSASAASTSASNASTSATNAANSATSAGTSATNAAASAASASGALAAFAGHRNVIINGGMNIWQRGVSVSTISAYTADQWTAFMNGSGATLAATRQATTSQQPLLDLGFSNYLSYALSGTITGATVNQFIQNIEGVQTLSGRAISVSFWAWCASGTLACNLVMAQNFGTGGSPSANVTTTLGVLTVTTTPQKFTFSGTLPSIFGQTLGSNGDDRLRFVMNMPLNVAMTLNITGVQVEEGSAVTPFELRAPAVEWALCQRYYRTGNVQLSSYGAAGATGASMFAIAPMRTVPTATSTYGTQSNCSGSTLAAVDSRSILMSTTVTALGTFVAAGSYTLSAEL